MQWSLRFGLIVFDDGHLRRAAALIATSKPWPDAERKRRQAEKSADLARRMVASGDQDAALEQVRTALSLAARARLLHAGVFPGSRDELQQQLADLDLREVGDALATTIHRLRPACRPRAGRRSLRRARRYHIRRRVDRLEPHRRGS